MVLHVHSHCKSVGSQAPVLVFETHDGQVFIRRGLGLHDDDLELTIHEYDQLIADAKAGKLDRS